MVLAKRHCGRISNGRDECNGRSLWDDNKRIGNGKSNCKQKKPKARAKAETTATADPCGMTNKRTGNGERKSKSNCNRRSLRDDKQKNRQLRRREQLRIPPLRCGMTTKKRARVRTMMWARR
jgi:hypothetical protein